MDATSPLGLLSFLAPQLPALLATTLWHTLGMTEQAAKWDLRTTITVQIMRRLLTGGDRKPEPVGKVQARTLKDPGIKGKMWVAKAVVVRPTDGEEGVREAVFRAVGELGDGGESYTRPDLEDVEVEWTGYRPGAAKDELPPDISEAEKYTRLMAEPSRTSDVTVLFMHGGAYSMCDPATHRGLCSRLAKECGGRACSLRYRLAPQHAFPAQLLDALLVYLSLVYPPAGSMHAPVPAEHIVLAGDSAGGNLAFALLQLLLQLHRTSPHPTVHFHGRDVPVPLPAGCSAHSGWFDVSRCMPSLHSNAHYDYLPPPSPSRTLSRFPPDSIWPATPPRGDLFCDLSLLTHPLVSPLAARDWTHAPPLWIECGTETLADEAAVLAQTAAAQGVPVQWKQYDAMPHCFTMVLPTLPQTQRCMESWGVFCRGCVERPEGLRGGAVFVEAPSCREEGVDVQALTGITREEVKRRMEEERARKVRAFEGEGRGALKPSL